jgi:integrase
MLLRLVQGRWPPASVATTPAEILHKGILEDYFRWMGDLRGLSPQTVEDRVVEASRFLGWVGECGVRERLGALTRLDVDLYMKGRAVSLHRRSLNGLAMRLRSLLRFLYTTGQTMNDLAMTVIAPPVHAFEGIPSAMLPEDVGKVLEAARQDGTAKGIRDYAILLLIAKYGVRAGEVTALRLDDVDWRKELIRIRHSKTGAMSCLPLLPEVGEALLNYLQQSRPRTSFREIFIRCQAPYRPFRNGSSLYGMVQWRLAAANVVPVGKRGPHSFRHARAVSMLRASVPVKEIGDLLGHRAADSTLVYLKLATDDLRAVAMEIPAGVKI